MTGSRPGRVTILTIATAATAALFPCAAPAYADNQRLNNAVVSNIYSAERQNGCTAELHRDARLTESARRHALDAVEHPGVDADVGSDGSTVQTRAHDAGFRGDVAQTTAFNPALAISGIEILQQWWNDPAARTTMQDCRFTQVGVWSENRLSRSVVVAVYGAPAPG